MDEPQNGNSQTPIAHQGGGGKVHGLAEHLCGTADLACRFAAPWGGGEAAQLAAIWHDLGKYAAEFQAMIRAAGENGHLEQSDSAPKARVDHSTAGAQWAVKKFGPIYGSMLAYVIAGHHAGLADWSGGNTGRHGLNDRLIGSDGIDRALTAMPASEILECPAPTHSLPKGADASLLVRMLASAVFDADFLDTEAFFDREKARTRTASQWPTIETMAERLKHGMEERFGPRPVPRRGCAAASDQRPLRGMFPVFRLSSGGLSRQEVAGGRLGRGPPRSGHRAGGGAD